MSDATETVPSTRLPASAFTFVTDKRKVTNPITNEEIELEYRYAKAGDLEQARALTGGDDRICDIVSQRNKGRFASHFSDVKLKKITTQEEWDKHVAAALKDAEDVNEVLASTRGTGANAKAKKYDELQDALGNLTDPMEIVARLRALGLVQA